MQQLLIKKLSRNNSYSRKGNFPKNEPIILNGEKTDLSVVETRDDFIKLDGLDMVKKGDRITGRTTGVSAEIVDLKPNLGNLRLIFQIVKNMVG